jgi:hypothetical protein
MSLPEARPAGGEIVVLNKDLFFGVKIGNTLRALGYTVTFTKTTEDFLAKLGSSTALGIIDLAANADWNAIGAANLAAPTLVFGSHLDVEGLRAAKAAGVTRVVSNGEFHREMVTLVERYAKPTLDG